MALRDFCVRKFFGREENIIQKTHTYKHSIIKNTKFDWIFLLYREWGYMKSLNDGNGAKEEEKITYECRKCRLIIFQKKKRPKCIPCPLCRAGYIRAERVAQTKTNSKKNKHFSILSATFVLHTKNVNS